MERMEITHVTPGAQLTDMSIDELAQRASLIAKVLAEVGDAEAALLAEQMADKARDSRNIAAIDAELVDRSEAAKDPAA
jgi:hypothetical protein